MPEEIASKFGAGAGEWAAYSQGPLGRIRREVTWHNLSQHLPRRVAGESSLRVLDVGGGSGELAIKFLRRGCLVWLVDCAEGMLEQARKATLDLPHETQSRLSLLQLDAADVPDRFAPETFDVITCHTLIEYLHDPKTVLGALVSLLQDGGLLSVSFVNRHAELLRRVWSHGDPAGALEYLSNGDFCAALFDVAGRAYTAKEVIAWMEEVELASPTVYGVRAFADYVSGERLSDPDYFDAMMKLEISAASCRPYSSIARYAHLVAKKA